MLPVERIIGEEGLSATDGALRLAMRLPWYRSLPFSVVEVGALELDGTPVDLTDARIEYDGAAWPLAENGDQTNRFWFVRDSAYLIVPDLAIQPGESHAVALTLHISPPYIPGMRRMDQQSETLVAA